MKKIEIENVFVQGELEYRGIQKSLENQLGEKRSKLAGRKTCGRNL
jgi:hypothetical protein